MPFKLVYKIFWVLAMLLPLEVDEGIRSYQLFYFTFEIGRKNIYGSMSNAPKAAMPTNS